MRLFRLEDEISGVPMEDEIEPDLYEIWRDNLTVLNIFLSLSNKWNIVAAPDGELVRTGIWLPNVEVVLRYTDGVPRRKWPEFMADIEAMESAALWVMRKAREERREKRQEELEASRKSR